MPAFWAAMPAAGTPRRPRAKERRNIEARLARESGTAVVACGEHPLFGSHAALRLAVQHAAVGVGEHQRGRERLPGLRQRWPDQRTLLAGAVLHDGVEAGR